MRKLVLGVVIASAALVLGVWGSFYLWKQSLAEKLVDESVVVMTDAGKVEYALQGQGPMVAVLHGTPGGYDQVFASSGSVPDEMSLLAISRPGYLRTPIESGRTPQAQADLLAALLDNLNEKKITVVGVSGGGPAALQFALRHPDRTQALILLSARTKAHPLSDDEDARRSTLSVELLCLPRRFRRKSSRDL